MPVDGAQYFAFGPDDVSPSRNKFFQFLGNPYKPALTILVRLRKPKPQRRLAFYDHMHDYVTEFYEEDEVKPKTLAPALTDMRACKSPDESDAILKFCAEVNWDWLELQQDVFEYGGYNIPYIERDIDNCHERIGKLQKNARRGQSDAGHAPPPRGSDTAPRTRARRGASDD